jgi:hypothetical protein
VNAARNKRTELVVIGEDTKQWNMLKNFSFHEKFDSFVRKNKMTFSRMKWLTIAFSVISLALFISLYQSHAFISTFIISLSGALVFFAVAVMRALVKVHKRHIGQLQHPIRVGSVAFALTGVAGATRSVSLGLSTGAWEYWVIMTNMLLFVFGVLMLWYRKFIQKLLQDVKGK